MFELDLLLRMKIRIPDELNQRFEDGEPRAYQELENRIKNRMNIGVVADENLVTRVQIEDAGPYNDAGQWNPSIYYCEDEKHDWQEQPGEPPVDVCSKCGLNRR